MTTERIIERRISLPWLSAMANLRDGERVLSAYIHDDEVVIAVATTHQDEPAPTGPIWEGATA